MRLKPDDTLQGRLDRYHILEPIGSPSGIGAVFRAKDSRGRFVVVKQLLAPTAGNRKEHAYHRKSFRREARILLENKNPKIVRAYELIEAGEDLILVMEAINGIDLAQALAEQKRKHDGDPFPQETVFKIGLELCEVIHYIHTLPGQIVYRDLKPANVMWDSVAGTIRLIDFGTARFASRSRFVTMGLGTEGYAAPELYNLEMEVDFRADVYSIGATLYELLTGEAPEPKKMPTHFRGYDTRIHPRFRAIVLKALDQVPANRYPTANDMRRALLDIPNVQEWMPRPLLPLHTRPRNLHPLYASFCPACGHPPKRTTARYCGKCRKPYHTAFLKIFPSRPDLFPMELYLKGRRTLIGREDPENEIFPDIDLSRFDEGRYVSRRHAVIERRGGRFVLRTISTTNPTLLEGKRLPPDHEVPLEPGARLQFADLVAAFTVKPCFEAFEISPSHPVRRDGTEGNR